MSSNANKERLGERSQLLIFPLCYTLTTHVKRFELFLSLKNKLCPLLENCWILSLVILIMATATYFSTSLKLEWISNYWISAVDWAKSFVFRFSCKVKISQLVCRAPYFFKLIWKCETTAGLRALCHFCHFAHIDDDTQWYFIADCRMFTEGKQKIRKRQMKCVSVSSIDATY